MDTLLKEIKENKAYLLVVIAGLAMALYHMTATQVILQAAKAHLNTHLGFCLLLVFLGSFATNKSKNNFLRFWPLILAIVAFACTLYVQILWPEIENRSYFNTPLDLVIGVILVFLVLEATRRDFGLILVLLWRSVALAGVVIVRRGNDFRFIVPPFLHRKGAIAMQPTQVGCILVVGRQMIGRGLRDVPGAGGQEHPHGALGCRYDPGGSGGPRPFLPVLPGGRAR